MVGKRFLRGPKSEKVSDAGEISLALKELSVRFEVMEQRINRLTDLVALSSKNRARTEQIGERNEHMTEQIEHAEQVQGALQGRPAALEEIHGRHREILAMLINGGFFTYKQMADKLAVSQSRVRAYIAELRNRYNIPLKQIRDAEGYKIGVELRFVEEILASKRP